MTQEHPITPPTELVEQRWNTPQVGGDFAQEFAAFFARWGADQELEACVEWLGDAPVVIYDNADLHPGSYLRDDRRPKPPSLKEQALNVIKCKRPNQVFSGEEQDAIRRALEALDD